MFDIAYSGAMVWLQCARMALLLTSSSLRMHLKHAGPCSYDERNGSCRIIEEVAVPLQCVAARSSLERNISR
jgi:hypothetical protein